MAPVEWPDAIDEVIGGDLTAALSYVTPAGGAVVTAVAPIGLRDRAGGTVSFTTSLGFGRKLDRIERDPRVALAYHAREHGHSRSPRYVLVQGSATVIKEPDRDYLDFIGRQATPFMGPPRRGVFWDRWLAAYYADRVPVHVEVHRVVSWPDLRCAGEPEVHGAGLPDPPQAQLAPAKGTGPRVDAARAGKALAKLPHQLVAFRGGDGHPVVVPVHVAGADGGGVQLETAPGLLPDGGRRAGLLAHSYRPKLIGLAARQHTGWLEIEAGRALYAPHTTSAFRAPANKTLLLLGNGYLARRGLKQAQAR
ncbi:MAG TPA: pyridoxamine 5'-phosphate oxidase family protein [Thermoleophilaceae bacterium]